MTTYSPNLRLIQPTPFDPAVANIWGTLLNTNDTLLDAAVAGILLKDVSGNTNIVLTNVNGAPDEARFAMFNFSGVLTGNVVALWPSAQSAIFTVKNSTTGAFTLSLGVNNGSGSPAGATATIPQGTTGIFVSDGTDVGVRVSPGSIGALAASANLADLANPGQGYINIGGGTMGTRALTIQNGGSPAGGADGDVTFIW